MQGNWIKDILSPFLTIGFFFFINKTYRKLYNDFFPEEITYLQNVREIDSRTKHKKCTKNFQTGKLYLKFVKKPTVKSLVKPTVKSLVNQVKHWVFCSVNQNKFMRNFY